VRSQFPGKKEVVLWGAGKGSLPPRPLPPHKAPSMEDFKRIFFEKTRGFLKLEEAQDQAN